MKNKKIVVFLLIAVMVLGFTLTALVGCKDWKDVSYDDMTEFLNTAVENTAKDKNLNNMNLGALMTIDTTYGESKKTYTIDFNATLALETSNSTANQVSLEIKDATNNKNVVSAYYHENDPAVYMLLGATKYKLNAFSVKKILEKNNENISTEEGEEIANAVTSGISDMFDTLNIIAGMDGVKTQVSKKGTTYRLSLNVGNLLNGLLNNDDDTAMAELVGKIVGDLGLDVDAKNLGAVLPALELGINVNVSSKKAEEAVITSISADLSCPSKDVKIEKKNSKGTLLQLNIAKDFSAKATIDLKFGSDVTPVFPQDYASYPAAIGAINLTAKGSFEIKQGIENVAIKVAGMDLLNINIPADTYNLEIGISADPAKLVEMDFTGIHCLPHAIDKAIEALNGALDYLNLKITTKAGADFLQIELSKNNGNLVVSAIKLDALGLDLAKMGLGNITSGNMAVKTVWESLSGNVIKPPANLDPGYAFVNESQGYKGGYKVDTDNGYVDADNDGNPDKDKNGNYVTKEGYTLYKGYPIKMEDCGYTKNEDGKWVVNTDAGYVKTSRNSETVKFDNNGDFAVAEGWTLYQRKDAKGNNIDPRPIPHNDLTEDELKAIADAKKEQDEAGLIPDTVKDLIDGLSIVASNGKISVTLGGMKFVLDDKATEKKYITLSASLSVDKSGLNVSATIEGLNEVKIEDGTDDQGNKQWTSLGLPEKLEALINIKLSDIKYGNAGK